MEFDEVAVGVVAEDLGDAVAARAGAEVDRDVVFGQGANHGFGVGDGEGDVAGGGDLFFEGDFRSDFAERGANEPSGFCGPWPET